MTLRIIVIALVMGVTVFGIFAAVQNAGKPQTFGTNVNYLFLALAGPLFIAGFVVPRLLPKGGTVEPTEATKNEPEEAAAIQAAFVPIQTATIVGCALFEGACFANLLAYFQDAELVHLVVAGIGLLFILLHFPLGRRIEEQIEDQLQGQRDQQQFKS
ncbi:MAG: hypothetical protein ACKVP0_14705 [Pirellulaceae bacterium]